MGTTFPPRNCSGCIAVGGRSNCSSNNSNSFCCSCDYAAAIRTRCARRCERPSWSGALQEEEGQALLRSVAVMPEPSQQSLVQAYLPRLVQWEAEDQTEETVGKSAQE